MKAAARSTFQDDAFGTTQGGGNRFCIEFNRHGCEFPHSADPRLIVVDGQLFDMHQTCVGVCLRGFVWRARSFYWASTHNTESVDYLCFACYRRVNSLVCGGNVHGSVDVAVPSIRYSYDTATLLDSLPDVPSLQLSYMQWRHQKYEDEFGVEGPPDGSVADFFFRIVLFCCCWCRMCCCRCLCCC